ncbi:MAG TPA: hypothetical protein VK092_08895 [Deinococcales bacterium]|nr:hypothetical protein [Deinococcales bacterium]
MSETVAERVFTVRQPAFSGSLEELLKELRSGRLLPGEVDLLGLVRDWLAYFEEQWRDDLESASEGLPLVARALELKLRLLLPRPPRDDGEEEEGEIIDTVSELVNFENAIRYLSGRREDRRLLFAAHAPAPALPRPRRPLGLKPGRLAELAGRLHSTGYFEVARSGFGFNEARATLLGFLKGRPRVRFSEMRTGHDWSQVTLMFAVLLELVRQGSVRVTQDRPGGELHIETEEAGDR